MTSRVGNTLLILCFVASTGIDLNAQAFVPAYHFKQINVQNGLTQNIVYHFLQDSRGYMWIGTQNGLSLFDGVKIINFLPREQDSTSLSGNFISSIVEDSTQQIWIGNENGIDLYNRLTNSFTHFGVDRPDGTKDYTYCVLMGVVSADELWFLDTKTRSVRSMDLKTRICSFVADLNTNNARLFKGSGKLVNIWSSYDKGTIHQVYQNKKLVAQETYFSGTGGGMHEPQLLVSDVFQQNDTTAWLSTNEGLIKLNPATRQYRIFNKWGQQTVNELRYAALSSTGQLWVGSGPSGVYIFDVATNQFVQNLRNDKLDPSSVCSDNIVSLYFDRMGNIWCGSFGSGTSYANTENVFFANHISKEETGDWKGNNNISWLGVDNHGNLWCMMADAPGFWILNKDLKISGHRNPLQENGAHYSGSLYKLLFDKTGEIWCSTNKGLFKYDGLTNIMHPVKYELISEEVQGSIWIKDIFQLNDASIIFSTYVGLYRLTMEAGKPVVRPVTFLKPGEYSGFGSLFQDESGFVYVKSLGHFLYVLKPGVVAGKYELIQSISFIPDINSYFEEKGDSIVYLATTDGVYSINNRNFRIKKEDLDKLPFLNVSSVYKKEKKLWAFGVKGLYFFDQKSRQGRTYTVEDGLPANEFSLSPIVFGPGQRCIAGTANGLVSFFPDQLNGLSSPPRVQLSGIYINDAPFSAAPASNEIESIHLSFRQNTFSFDFSPITFQHPAECGFEYKLEKYDESWIKSGLVNHTRYSKIPPGNYVFNIRVLDPGGWSSPFVKTLAIRISRAYWQTGLFKAAALAFILSIGWLIARWYFSYKIRKQKREFEKQQLIEKERTRIATDMHDDLGAGLSRIKFLSQSILNKRIDDEAIKTELEKITSFSDEMSEKMGEIVWALNEKNDTLADLIAYTRSYVVEYLANHNIECEADTPMHLPGTFITGEMRRNIFLSVKECLHNIVKHSGATKVCFSVRLNGTMQIAIHDNGKGIDWNNLRAFSNGIQNINRRMKEIHGDVSFVNEGGTKVLMTIPFI